MTSLVLSTGCKFKYDISGCETLGTLNQEILRFCRCSASNVGVYRYTEKFVLKMEVKSSVATGRSSDPTVEGGLSGAWIDAAEWRFKVK